jgi:hypothetical protein
MASGALDTMTHAGSHGTEKADDIASQAFIQPGGIANHTEMNGARMDDVGLESLELGGCGFGSAQAEDAVR